MIENNANWDLIPEHMRGAVKRYIEQHIAPGHFLLAVLSNNLKDACARADGTNATRLHDYVKFFYNYAPSACWGSPAKVDEWLASYPEE